MDAGITRQRITSRWPVLRLTFRGHGLDCSQQLVSAHCWSYMYGVGPELSQGARRPELRNWTCPRNDAHLAALCVCSEPDRYTIRMGYTTSMLPVDARGRQNRQVEFTLHRYQSRSLLFVPEPSCNSITCGGTLENGLLWRASDKMHECLAVTERSRKRLEKCERHPARRDPN